MKNFPSKSDALFPTIYLSMLGRDVIKKQLNISNGIMDKKLKKTNMEWQPSTSMYHTLSLPYELHFLLDQHVPIKEVINVGCWIFQP